MRVAVAATLVLLLALAVVTPHVHTASSPEECAACVVRGGEVAQSQVPEVAPLPAAVGELAVPLPSRPGEGAPLGAIPGQSPPHA